ncbi:UDP-glucose dehydrogenase family protein [Luteimicrobium sp. NPDC057192]|uniref:UDP-glucose dehydrogenase family protein n=1 Tax=Luteimicrobium sp. NPDC057192 TaxID=3346042 RepID=UPI0036333CE8
MRISVVGCGYLGAVHAAALAELGHHVVGLDTDAALVAALEEARPPFYEPGFDDLLHRARDRGRLRFTTDPAALAGARVHFVCVGTPEGDGGAADLRYVDAALAELAPSLRPGDLVVGKSTVPVGTARGLAGLVPASVGLAWNPEFLREGHAVADTLRPDRLVYGAEGPRAAEAVGMLDDVYRPLLAAGVPRLVVDLPTAELAKVAANAFLATKVSFANAMAEVCAAAGGDAVALTRILGRDPRIGPAHLGAGLGFGGSCLPKDVRAFAVRAEELGAPGAAALLHDVDALNDQALARVAALVEAGLAGASGRRVAVLGAAFKPDSDDVRCSPALALAGTLRDGGADVVVTDPRALDRARAAAPGLACATTVDETVRGADVVVLATEWDEYRALDPARLGRLAARRVLVDARHAVDADGWRDAGWRVLAPGRTEPRRPGAGATRPRGVGGQKTGLPPVTPRTVPDT